MLGLHSNRENRSSSYASISMVAAVLSLFLGIFVGPTGIYISSSIGSLIALWSFVLSLRVAALSKPMGFPIVVLGIHCFFLVIGFALQSLFLKPLAADSKIMPRFQFVYSDPGGLFQLRGPAGWHYENLPSRYEAGVRMRPSEKNQYVGISEITVLIRKLEKKPKSPDNFLQQMASTWVDKKKSESNVFEFEITPAQFLNTQKKGLWAILDAKRFWVPIKQVSLLGIKNQIFLCSVSAIGLKNHATLSNVFCLGLFETIKIDQKEK